MNTGIARRAVWAGTITALVLVVAFGNQWLWEEILEQEEIGPNSGWNFLVWLSTPHWVVDPSGMFEGMEDKHVAGGLVGCVALLLTVALVIGAAARRDGSPAFVTGWFSLVAGGAAYGLVNYLISGTGLGVTALARDDGDRTLSSTLGVLAVGGGYGLLVGWIVGLACVLATASGRSMGYASSFPPVPPRDRPY